MMWMHGEKGEGLSQFYIPHSVAADNFQRVGLQNIYNPQFPINSSTRIKNVVHHGKAVSYPLFVCCMSGVGCRPRK